MHRLTALLIAVSLGGCVAAGPPLPPPLSPGYL